MEKIEIFYCYNPRSPQSQLKVQLKIKGFRESSSVRYLTGMGTVKYHKLISIISREIETKIGKMR